MRIFEIVAVALGTAVAIIGVVWMRVLLIKNELGQR